MLVKTLFVCIIQLAALFINIVVAEIDVSLTDIKAVARGYMSAEQKQTAYHLSAWDNIELAYLIQSSYVQQKNQSISGYKIGLSSTAAQNKFNYHSPVFGVLLKYDQQPRISTEKTKLKYLVELELAFQVKESIDNLDQLNQPIENLVSAVLPVVELPMLNFNDIKKIRAFDIIATNVGAAGLIKGNTYELSEVNINHIQVELWKNDEKIMHGLSKAPMNNQLEALRWLLKQTLLQGYDTEKGQILLTGSILKPMFLHPGKYTARFQGLEDIDFNVE